MIPHRLALDGENFTLSFLNLGNAGGTWEMKGEGGGAFDLMRLLTKHPVIAEMCDRLAEWFPDRKASIFLTLAAEKSPAWRQFSRGLPLGIAPNQEKKI